MRDRQILLVLGVATVAVAFTTLAMARGPNPEASQRSVEAGRVDHGCHDDDAGAVLGEMGELDATLDLLLRERERRKDLLIVLTADHETGGLSVSSPKGEMLGADRIGLLATQRRSLEAVAVEGGAGVVFATDGHTATPVPVVAAGPGQERFGGLQDNPRTGRTLRDVLSGK